MKKIPASLFTSLDGVVEDPEWHLPYFSDEMGDAVGFGDDTM